MKTKMKVMTICVLLALAVVGAGCSLDNYEPPESELNGTVTYNGEAVGVSNGQVELELWQDGFELREKIPVNIRHDGTFSAMLFDGDYKLTMLAGDGPWVTNTDSIEVNLSGSADVELPVVPYYIIDNESITHSGGDIEASFDVTEINDSRSIEFIGLYVGVTMILDEQDNEESAVANINASGSLTGQSLSITLPGDLAGRDYVFTRIGVKTTGISDMLFTQVVEISL